MAFGSSLWRRRPAIVLLILVFLASGRQVIAAPPLTVMTTIFPLFELCRAIGKDRLDLRLLLPPGADVHAWEPAPGDLLKLHTARLFLYLGADMEPWVGDVLKAVHNDRLLAVAASALVPHARSDGEDQRTVDSGQWTVKTSRDGRRDHGKDPHLWLDLAWDRELVEKLVVLFAEADPEHADFYRANGDAYRQSLKALDERFARELELCRHRTFFVGGHGAFGYLAERYRLSQESLYGISPDAVPTPREMAAMVEEMRNGRIGYVFFEKQISDRLARTLARETGAKLLLLRSGANLTRQEFATGISFLDLMEENLENLKTALECP